MLKKLIITILFLTSGVLYYNLTFESPTTITAQVTKIIDGDTLSLNDSTKIRLLGVNTPEANQPYYQEAKSFLTSLENQTVKIEIQGTDKYNRTLAYIFHENQNINEALLLNGLATLYYYEKDSHYTKLKQAEDYARTNQIGIWKTSPNTNCIEIKIFKTNEPEQVTLQNNCNYQINLTYKDDATHIYEATLEPYDTHTQTFSHIWNDEGDTLLIYDTKGLIKFQRY